MRMAIKFSIHRTGATRLFFLQVHNLNNMIPEKAAVHLSGEGVHEILWLVAPPACLLGYMLLLHGFEEGSWGFLYIGG